MKTVVLNRKYTLSSTRGHVIGFEKDKPTEIPDEVYPEAVAIGAVPADGSDPNVLLDAAPDDLPKTPEERRERIRKAIERVINQGQRGDFTAANAPHPTAVSREAGFRCDGREIRPIWEKIQAREEA